MFVIRVAALFSVIAAIATAGIPPSAAPASEFRGASGLGPSKGGLAAQSRLMDASLPMIAKPRHSGPEAFDWFWKEVSPGRAAGDPQRWSKVLALIDGARASGRPVFGSPAAARRILESYGPALRREAARLNIALPLLIAVIEVESGGNPRARSPKGAGGLMQLMPGTAARFGVADAYAPTQNIRGGAQYLDWLLRYYDGDAVLALAGYNAGEGAVDRHSGVPPYAETRDYVAKVAGAYAAAKTLCATPPPTVRDICKVD